MTTETPRYRLTRRAFINGAFVPEGAEISYDGGPNEFMVPLNAEAEEKMKDFPGIADIIKAEHEAQVAAKAAAKAAPAAAPVKPAEPPLNVVAGSSPPPPPPAPKGPIGATAGKK